MNALIFGAWVAIVTVLGRVYTPALDLSITSIDSAGIAVITILCDRLAFACDIGTEIDHALRAIVANNWGVSALGVECSIILTRFYHACSVLASSFVLGHNASIFHAVGLHAGRWRFTLYRSAVALSSERIALTSLADYVSAGHWLMMAYLCSRITGVNNAKVVAVAASQVPMGVHANRVERTGSIWLALAIIATPMICGVLAIKRMKTTRRAVEVSIDAIAIRAAAVISARVFIIAVLLHAPSSSH